MFECDSDKLKKTSNKIGELLENVVDIYNSLCNVSGYDVDIEFINNIYDAEEVFGVVKLDLIELNNKVRNVLKELGALPNEGEFNINYNVWNFDDVWNYGGDQEALYYLYDAYLKKYDLDSYSQNVIDSTFKILEASGITDPNDIDKVLFNFRNCGCAEIASSNMIINAYSSLDNGEKLFEAKYGFPMSYEFEDDEREIHKINNYNLLGLQLMIDYSKVDNKSVFDFNGSSSIELSSVIKNQSTENISFDTSYMTSSDFKSTDPVKYYEDNSLEYPYLILSTSGPFAYKNADDFVYTENSDTNHAMFVPATSKNGYFIVSTWGDLGELTDGNTNEFLFIKTEYGGNNG